MRKRILLSIFTLVCILTIYMVLIYSRLQSVGSISAFIVAGNEFTTSGATPDPIPVLDNSDGYDGQFYYRLALDPFTDQITDYGIRLDNPEYRQQRILYPVLARLLSKLSGLNLPTAMFIINIVACGSIIASAFFITSWYRVSPLWAALLTLYPGVFGALFRNLTELVELAFVMLALIFYLRRCYIGYSVSIALAALGRETAVIVIIAIFISESLSHKRIAAEWLIPFSPFIIWRFWLLQNWWGIAVPYQDIDHLVGIPFVGIIRSLQIGRDPQYVLLIGALFCIALYSFMRSSVCVAIKLAWVLHSAMLVSLSILVWYEGWAFWRVTLEWYVLSIMIIMMRIHYKVSESTLSVFS